MKEILRLPGEYQRTRAFDRVKLLVGFPLRPNGMLIALLPGAASCWGQTLLSTSAADQGSAPPGGGGGRIAIEDPVVASTAGSLGKVSGERPRLLVGMIKGGGGRPGGALSQPASLAGDAASDLELDRRSPIIASPKTLSRARESVRLRGSTEVPASDRAQDGEFSPGTQQSAEFPAEIASSFSLLPEDGLGGWRESLAPRAANKWQRADSDFAADEAGRDFLPIRGVGLGGYAFPASLCVPGLRDEAPPK
jgi:hypothetical protein